MVASLALLEAADPVARTLPVDDNFDVEYVRRLMAGDPEVERHFSAYFTVVMRIKLRSRIHFPQLIADIRQETFLRVLRYLRSPNGLKNPERLGAFVHSVCNHVMLEMLRGHSRYSQILEDTPEAADGDDDPAQNALTTERRRLVKRVLAELSPRDRDLIQLVFFEERKKDQICREMGVNREYLRVLVCRAKSRFRALYQKYDS